MVATMEKTKIENIVRELQNATENKIIDWIVAEKERYQFTLQNGTKTAFALFDDLAG